MRAIAFLLLLGACHEEPPIVIKFEPQDLSAKSAPAAADAATPPPSKAVADAGAALEPPKKGAAECKSADDCGLVIDGCCDCNNGGKQKAVTKAQAAAWKRDPKCRGMMCMHMISIDPSCKEKAACVSGKCVLSGKP